MTWELTMIGVAEAARAHRDAEAALDAHQGLKTHVDVPVAAVDKALDALEQAQWSLERQEAVLRGMRKDVLKGAGKRR